MNVIQEVHLFSYNKYIQKGYRKQKNDNKGNWKSYKSASIGMKQKKSNHKIKNQVGAPV